MPKIVLSYIREDRVEPYLEALAVCGVSGESVFRATPLRAVHADLDEVVATADGLLLAGGVDIQPCLYGEARIRAANLDRPVADRDQMEWDLLSRARDLGTPVFGICRGHQMINVFLGGSLYQDLELLHGATGHDCFIEDGFALDHLAHEVSPARVDHPLADWLAHFAPLPVNSRHHQGSRDLAKGLVAVAHSADGVVEAAALESTWWVRSVQWHPENLVDLPAHRGLFEQFLAAAAEFEALRPIPVAVR